MVFGRPAPKNGVASQLQGNGFSGAGRLKNGAAAQLLGCGRPRCFSGAGRLKNRTASQLKAK